MLSIWYLKVTCLQKSECEKLNYDFQLIMETELPCVHHLKIYSVVI